MFCENLLPLDLYLEWDASADLFNNLQVFYWWCAHRILNIDREYAKNLLNSCGLKQASTDRDRAFIALQYKCLHQDNWGYLFDESNHIIGFAPVFDFNHAFEADMEFTCLPELLLGRRKSSLEAAKAAYKELGIELSYVNATDDYSKFVNDRIRILRS